MAVEYETLVQGGHSKFAEEIFKKTKVEVDAVNEKIEDLGLCVQNGLLCAKWKENVNE